MYGTYAGSIAKFCLQLQLQSKELCGEALKPWSYCNIFMGMKKNQEFVLILSHLAENTMFCFGCQCKQLGWLCCGISVCY